jgi:hypothetical protein
VPNISRDTDSSVHGLPVHQGGVDATFCSPHSSEDMTYNNFLLALLMGGGNVYDDLLTRNKDLRLMDSFYNFGGILERTK